VSSGYGPVVGFQGILPGKKFEISMLNDAMTGHLTGCGGANLHDLLTSASSS